MIGPAPSFFIPMYVLFIAGGLFIETQTDLHGWGLGGIFVGTFCLLYDLCIMVMFARHEATEARTSKSKRGTP